MSFIIAVVASVMSSARAPAVFNTLPSGEAAPNAPYSTYAYWGSPGPALKSRGYTFQGWVLLTFCGLAASCSAACVNSADSICATAGLIAQACRRPPRAGARAKGASTKLAVLACYWLLLCLKKSSSRETRRKPARSARRAEPTPPPPHTHTISCPH